MALGSPSEGGLAAGVQTVSSAHFGVQKALPVVVQMAGRVAVNVAAQTLLLAQDTILNYRSPEMVER